jgi:tetratricopeptide (TPR) repeat protein
VAANTSLADGSHDPREHGRIGNELFEAGRHAEAAPRLRLFAEAFPGDVQGWRQLALCLDQTGEEEEAAKAWGRVLSINPKDARARERSAWLLLSLGRGAEAEPLLGPVQALGTKAPKGWARLGRRLQAQGDGEGALAAMRIVAAGSEDPAHHAMLGEVLFIREAWAEALPHLLIAGAGWPAKGWMRLAIELEAAGELEGATQALTAALAQTESLDGRRRLVALLLRLGRAREVEPHVEALIAGGFGDGKSWGRLALDLEAQGEPLGAARAWAASLLQGENLEARRRAATLLLEAGRAEEARPHLAALAAQGVDDPKAWLQLARARQDAGDAAGEAAAFELALALGAEGSVHEAFGEALYASGELKAAAPHLRAAVEANPSAKAWERLSLCLEEAGDPEGAVEARRGRMALTGEQPRNRERLGELLLELGRGQEALVEFGASPELQDLLERLGGDRLELLQGALSGWRDRWPEGGWAFNGLLIALARTGRRGEAVELFLRAERRVPSYGLRNALADLAGGGPKPRPMAADRSAPPVLISQVERCGGTLLARLFDGHPQLRTWPGELEFGFPRTWAWPELDLNAKPQTWLESLLGSSIERSMASGLHFDAVALHDRFMSRAAGASSRREVIDAYLDALFTAWGDARPTGRERWTVGSCARLAMNGAGIQGFFDDYPDGRLISCVRDPAAWFVSSVRHSPEFASLEAALPLWSASVRAGLELAAARPGRVLMVSYESLVTDTEAQMRRLAAALDIAFDPGLTVPTFAGEPAAPNSSFAIAETGVHRRSLDQRARLSPAELETIERQAMPLYREALAFIGSSTSPSSGSSGA